MFEKTLAHEQYITLSLNTLMDLARDEHDHATQILLQWYITEQIEEEQNDNDIINDLKLAKDDPRAILMLDRELAARAVTVPTNFALGVEAQLNAGVAP